MPLIRQLSPSIINKIAAGEVIERPASVVKELVENAIDAGATRIEVSLAQGGLECVRVADNGCGIASEQLPLALASHATSKIADADDLFRVGTLGFRGEALASIAEVSRLVLRSRTGNETAGAEIESTGGALRPPAPCGCPVGTTIEVRNLFFNTPVRRKFLRTTQTEMGHCSEAFTRLALAWPSVHFSLKHNERTLFELPPVESWRERIAVFFGREIADGLIAVESRDDDVLLSGYAADPQFSRSHNRMQYLFLNGRHIRDRALGHALQEAYRGLLLHGRHPIAFLRLAMPPEAVDVNVHPTKLEVRFQDGGRLYSQLLGCLRKKFLATDLSARVHAAPANGDDISVEKSDAEIDRRRQELVDWAKGQLTAAHGEAGNYNERGGSPTPEGVGQAARHFALEAAPVSPRQAGLELRYDEPAPSSGLVLHRIDPAALAVERNLFRSTTAAPTQAAVTSPGACEPALRADPAAIRGSVQLHNRYLVTENDEGMVVIDQHALHERILYEQLKRKVMAGAVETQRLLAPETVALSAHEAAAAIEARDLLAQLGIEIEPFGGDTVVVRGYPAMIARLSPGELVRQAVEQLVAGGRPERRDLLDDLLNMIACKAAIKAGDALSQEEVDSLLAQRHLCDDSHHCPHGRPTALVFTRAELIAASNERKAPPTQRTPPRPCFDMICVSIGRGRHKHLIAEHRHLVEQGAQLVEIRLDYIKREINLKRILRDRPCPIIISCRRERDGGKWTESEAARLILLRSAIVEGVEYIDLEDDIAKSIPRYGKTKRIISHHNFRETPYDLEYIHERLAGMDADFVKIATMAHHPEDNLRMLRLVKKSKVPTVGLCMGEIGTPSRILAGKFGSPFTYATFHHERSLAPGQLSYRQMVDIYRYNEINAETEVYGVIADPVGHSLSHLIHNAAFAALKMNRVYVPFRVPREDLDEFMANCRELGIKGLSVTIPHKESVLRHLHRAERAVRGIEAANTIIMEGDANSGFNTDFRAAMDTLADAMGVEESEKMLSGKIALVLGSGGVSKAIAFGLKRRGADVVITARTSQRAEELAERLDCRYVDWIVRHSVKCDVLINGTPMGMHPNVDESPYEHRYLRPAMIVFDTVYNPEQTLLIKDAKRQGCKVITGVEMFVRQAALQFKLFTEQDAPLDLMREAVKRAIGAARPAGGPEDLQLPE